MFRIKLSNHAEKDLKKLPQNYKLKIAQILDLLKMNPFLGNKMSGDFKGSYRVKIPPIRIVYIPDIKQKIIHIRVIGYRQGVYK